MSTADLSRLENNLGYTFCNKEHLQTALTHKSYTNEKMINKGESYERYEFLGDAILEFIVSEFLFKEYPSKPEGELTKLRASLVCEFTLSKIARELELGENGFFSKGELKTGGPRRDSILCDMFESVLGAVYIDGGLDAARDYVRRFLLKDIEHKALFYDSKSRLQEKTQKSGSKLIYEVIDVQGPEHDAIYNVRCLIDGEEVSRGTGHSKKTAEQEAAYNALIKDK